MEAYMSDFSNFFEQSHEFGKSECTKKINCLKAEIDILRKKDAWEIQTFMIRQFGVRLKQKEVINVFDEILHGLGNF
jgi:hypothetical protein